MAVNLWMPKTLWAESKTSAIRFGLIWTKNNPFAPILSLSFHSHFRAWSEPNEIRRYLCLGKSADFVSLPGGPNLNYPYSFRTHFSRTSRKYLAFPFLCARLALSFHKIGGGSAEKMKILRFFFFLRSPCTIFALQSTGQTGFDSGSEWYVSTQCAWKWAL